MSKENSSICSGAGCLTIILGFVLGVLLMAFVSSLFSNGVVIAKVDGEDPIGLGWYKNTKNEIIATNFVTGKQSANLAVLCALDDRNNSQKFGDIIVCLFR